MFVLQRNPLVFMFKKMHNSIINLADFSAQFFCLFKGISSLERKRFLKIFMGREI